MSQIPTDPVVIEEPAPDLPPGPAWPPGQEPKVTANFAPLDRIPPNPRPPYAGLPLREGSTGAPVRHLQRLLGVPETGAFDARTTAALRAFQVEVGAPDDAAMSPRLWRILWDRKVLGRSDRSWRTDTPAPTTPRHDQPRSHDPGANRDHP